MDPAIEALAGRAVLLTAREVAGFSDLDYPVHRQGRVLGRLLEPKDDGGAHSPRTAAEDLAMQPRLGHRPVALDGGR